MTRRSRRLARRRRTSAPVKMLLATLGTTGAIVCGVLAGGGTYAAWSVSAPAAAAATLQAGSAELSTDGVQLSATGLYPGRTVYGSSAVRNTGTTPLALSLDSVSSATTNAFTGALVVTVGVAASTADCAAGRVAPTVTTRVAPDIAGDLRVTLAPAATTVMCVGLGLPQNAPAAAAGAAASALTLTITGIQVRP
ncbi:MULTISPECIES: hypothetical protein [unclassified Microbacterium]|uniref:hypothetical protein n=1 Tax=unclassified Microbacterium TaxID=2609290 RepID=UPI00214CD0C3|nr:MULTISPECIES: hypothetical protein [unclassified Microbacterium]MCR2783154.1 hypothetical protein [Microbacterium sp. zg.B96]WIM15966.1 hypothetical protein QNO11_15775 [Microbacterium sp. zg-B96]